MAGNDWLGNRRSEVAADRILDAAGELFAHHQISQIGMNQIARAAGCSRATLYRYFENRESLHTAYVNREALRTYERLTAIVADIEDPREKLLATLTTSIGLVRQSPPLAAWFTTGDTPIGTEIAERSDVIRAMIASFLSELQPEDQDALDRRSRWIVRVLTSLLSFPGNDADDEREMLREFVMPVVFPR